MHMAARAHNRNAMAMTSKLSIVLLLSCSCWAGPIEPSALSLRLILGTKGHQPQQSLFQERSGSSLGDTGFPDESTFFTAQARMALHAQPIVPFDLVSRRDLEIQPDDSPIPSAQRRMDADEELLAQMPFSSQRRVDLPNEHEGLLQSPNGGEPLTVIPIQLVGPQQANAFPDMSSQPMPFFIQLPMNQPRMDMPNQPFPMQMPMMSEMPPMGPPPRMEPVAQAMFQAQPMPRNFQPMPMLQSLPEDVESASEDGEGSDVESEDGPSEKVDEIQEEMPATPSTTPAPASAPVAMQAEQQRIVVVQQSAARLRPVVVDSLETVLQFFNAVAPQAMANATTTPAPREESEGRNIEDLTSQVADALSSLTAQAKKLLPVILQAGRNLTAGLAEQGLNATARLDPVINEVTPAPSSSPSPMTGRNLTETISRYVHINQDDFRRTWKHFLHNYWNYVQKVLESIQ